MDFMRSLFPILEVPQVPQESAESPTDNQSSPTSSRSTSHKTGIPIAALDISPDRTHAVLAGHNILKTIQVSDSTCTEDSNLRASIIAYAATHQSSGNASSLKHNDRLVANDVKWSHGRCSNIIATAAANGQIMVYDIKRVEVEIARLHEHTRQVHKLGFSPLDGHTLLSGSQDGTVRVWDLRDLAREKSVMTCQSRSKYQGNSDGIRDLSWSPKKGSYEFAFGTDNGTIQRWDLRDNRTPVLRVNAHGQKTCHSIDWHPDGIHLVSGGADMNIKVWDFSSIDRKKKPLWEFQAPQAVLNVRWRPASWQCGKQGPGRWQCSQIATSYDEQDPRIDIWDLRRPYVPFSTLHRHDTPATTILWHSENLLWSVGSVGMFTQTDVKFAPRLMDQRSPNTVDVAANGQILYFSEKKKRGHTSVEDRLKSLSLQNRRRSSPGDGDGGSPSTGPGGAEELKLRNSSMKLRQRKPPASLRSTMSSAETPPSLDCTTVEGLEKTLHPSNMYQVKQVAAIGFIEGLFDKDAFKVLAYYEKPEIPTKVHATCNLHEVLGDVLRHNATLATTVNKHQLSQTFVILAEGVEKELGARAELNYQLRTRADCAETSKEETSEEPNDDLSEHTSHLYFEQRIATVTAPNGAVSGNEHLQLPDGTWSKQMTKPVSTISDSPSWTAPNFAGKGVDTTQDTSHVLSPEKDTSDDAHNYILADFIKLDEKPDDLPPWAASHHIDALINYHAQKLYDTQFVTWLIFHLGRWLNHSISYERALTIFQHYHKQLVDLELFDPACEVRRLAHPEFPEIYKLSSYETGPSKFWCVECQQPQKGRNLQFCGRCKTKYLVCYVCKNDRSPIAAGHDEVCENFENPRTTDLWRICPGCLHGGHVRCLEGFWALPYSEGMCSIPGCFHDCMPGKLRDEREAEQERERAKQKPGVISKDEWEVPESPAAQRARGIVGENVHGRDNGGSRGGRGGRNLGDVGRAPSGGRRVRIVEPNSADVESACEEEHYDTQELIDSVIADWSA